jgi:hypothetical protein
MLESLDATLLARLQFAFTISFHIVFPAFTIGLASWLAVLEWRWLSTGNPVYADIYRMWVRIFAVTFGMGVVSGVVMSFQFGTNWSVFADKGGNVLGPLLGYEVLTAFFLEASFLGVMLFGWNRVSPKMHFAATVIVAAGPDFGLLDSVGQQLDANTHWFSCRKTACFINQLDRGDFQPFLPLPLHPHGNGRLPDHSIRRRRDRRFLSVAAASSEARAGDAGNGHDHGHFRRPHAAGARRPSRPQYPKTSAR